MGQSSTLICRAFRSKPRLHGTTSTAIMRRRRRVVNTAQGEGSDPPFGVRNRGGTSRQDDAVSSPTRHRRVGQAAPGLRTVPAEAPRPGIARPGHPPPLRGRRDPPREDSGQGPEGADPRSHSGRHRGTPPRAPPPPPRHERLRRNPGDGRAPRSGGSPPRRDGAGGSACGRRPFATVSTTAR